MIRINLILKNKDIEKVLKSKIKSFFTSKSLEFNLCEDINAKGLNDDVVVSFFELESSADIKRAKAFKDSIEESCIIFLSKDESLVFESLRVNPLQFVRLNNFNEDLEIMFENLLEYISKRDTIITLKSGSATLRLNLSNIIFIESFGHYLTVHCTTGNYKVRGRLADIINEINNPSLLRTHKSYIINSSFIEKILQNRVTLKNNYEVPIGRAFREEVMKVIITR